MKKGIVMEVDDPYLTLLTPDGEFLRARKMDRLYSIGEEIDFFPVTDYLERKKTNLIKNYFTLRKVLMSVAVLIVSLGSLFPVYQSNKTYAYMSIDANTSIEMGLNKNMEVVEIRGFTKEAEQIISQLDDWKKKDASEITAIIVAELKDEGVIAQTDPVVISTVKTNQLKEKAAAKLQKNVDKIKQSIVKHPVEVRMYTATEAELEKALSSGVPVGIYHRSKNNSAKNNKETKEKTKQIKNTPSESSGNSTLPPDQQKKQAEKNSNPNSDNIQHEIKSDNNNAPVEMQKNGKQASPEISNGSTNKSVEERKSQQEKQKENNKVNKQVQNNPDLPNKQDTQDKQKTNNHNKSKKQENSGKK
jgi:Anti-sigma factor N-terminus